MTEILDPYKARYIHYLDTLINGGWKVKVYGISPTDSDDFSKSILQLKEKVLTQLPDSELGSEIYGVGFAIIHHGVMRNWFLIDWWQYQDILCHKLFSSPLNKPQNITQEVDIPAFACVHELRVINAESQAWCKLALNGSSDVDGYINAVAEFD